MTNTLTTVTAPRPTEKKLWRFPFFLLIAALTALWAANTHGTPFFPFVTEYIPFAANYGAWAVLALGMAGIIAAGGLDWAAGMLVVLIWLLRSRPEFSAMFATNLGYGALICGLSVLVALISGFSAGRLKLSAHKTALVNLLLAGVGACAFFGEITLYRKFDLKYSLIPLVLLVIMAVFIFRRAGGRQLRALGENPQMAALCGCGRFFPFAMAFGLSALGTGAAAFFGIDTYANPLFFPKLYAWLPVSLTSVATLDCTTKILLVWLSITLPLLAVVACGTGLGNRGKISLAGLFFAGLAIPLGETALSLSSCPHKLICIPVYYVILIILGAAVQKIRRAE